MNPTTLGEDREVLLAPDEGSALPQPFATMLSDYEVARNHESPADVGRHWDKQRADFERLIRTPRLWPRFRRFGLSFGFDDTLPHAHDLSAEEIPGFVRHTSPVAREWRFNDETIRHDIRVLLGKCGDTITFEQIEEMSEAKIGDPPAQHFSNINSPIDFHDLGLVYFATRLKSLVGDSEPTQILEIGGGYGGLGAKLKHFWPDAQIVLIDLPATSAVQQYYLRQSFPSARYIGAARWKEMSAEERATTTFDFLLLPPGALPELPDRSVDLAINIRSFMEMSRAFLTFYFGQLARLCGDEARFYCVNAISKKSSGEDIALVDYPFAPYWRMDERQEVPWQAHIHEMFLTRNEG